WSDDAQKRLTVVPGTLAGRPARRAARRARFIPCRSCGNPHPTITSTTSARSSSGTCFSAASIANATRSSGRASTSEPLRARPIGVRVAATMTASDKSVLPRECSSDDQLLDLARSLVEGSDARVSQVLPDRVLVDVAVAAVDLHGRVRGADRRLAGVVLGDRGLERVPDTRVRRKRGSPGEQARRLGLDGELRQALLHELERCDRAPELLPVLCIGDACLEAALADPDAARRQRDPTVVERRQRHPQPAALFAEHIRRRNPHTVERELTGVLRAQAELAFDRLSLEARRVGRDEEAGDLLAGTCEHERQAGPGAEGDEDLRAGDLPAVAVALGAGREAARVGAGP